MAKPYVGTVLEALTLINCIKKGVVPKGLKVSNDQKTALLGLGELFQQNITVLAGNGDQDRQKVYVSFVNKVLRNDSEAIKEAKEFAPAPVQQVSEEDKIMEEYSKMFAATGTINVDDENDE